MFKTTISRDNGQPWPSTGMTTARWMALEPVEVAIADLIATQPGIYFHALEASSAPYSLDVLPHVIGWQGELYLEDGHHRAIKALIAGRKNLQVRYLELDGIPAKKSQKKWSVDFCISPDHCTHQ